MSASKSLKAIIKHFLDYAGLFPPAKLNLEDAFRNYVRYKCGEYSSMLSKFICPVRFFPELMILLDEIKTVDVRIDISAIPGSSKNVSEFFEIFASDVKQMKKIREKENAALNFIEVKLPDELLDKSVKEISYFCNSAAREVKAGLGDDVFMYFESPPLTDWKKEFDHIINSIEHHNESEFNSGFKLRTGGIEQAAFPGPEEIAFCMRKCIDRHVPMKFTAGLHHPFRHFREEVNAKMHGFVNVFGAGVIAYRHNISNHELVELLNDENPDNFIFTDEYFSWRDWKIDIEAVEAARRSLVTSFGSCSFDEPVDDLKTLKLI